MSTFQAGIKAEVPTHSIYLFLSRKAGSSTLASKSALKSIANRCDGESSVIGLSAMLMQALGKEIPGLRTFPFFANAKVDLPITQSEVWLWLRGNDFGELFHRSRTIMSGCSKVFEVDSNFQAFKHRKGHDLTGFEDGTENPKGKAAMRAGFVSKQANQTIPQLEGSSFVAVMPWEHNFDQFDQMSQTKRNHAVGRDLVSNEELDSAPKSAHVKRTAQENFVPPAFSLRRSMPWTQAERAGLMFVSFGHSFDAFEAQLKRMSGADDGIVDGLFSFSRPIGGGFYWCPPVRDQAIDLP